VNHAGHGVRVTRRRSKRRLAAIADVNCRNLQVAAPIEAARMIFNGWKPNGEWVAAPETVDLKQFAKCAL
jgi:hypothetical protein